MEVYLGPYPEDHNDNREENIVLHNYDSWNVDSTIAAIAVPLLTQLRDTTHSSSYVELDDLPKDFIYDKEDTERFEEEGPLYISTMRAWQRILDEMIFSFQEIHTNKLEHELFDTYFADSSSNWTIKQKELDTRIQNGLRLFGKYYRSLWD